MMRSAKSCAAVTVFMLLCGGEVAAQRRGLQPEDLFRNEQIRSIAWSPDGRHVAIAITPGLRIVDGSIPHGPLWVLDTQRRVLRELTVPDTGVLGAWNAVWSPDGGRLAFLVLSETAEISAWVWRAGATVPTRIRDIEVPVAHGDRPLSWLDARTLLVVAWLPGVRPGGRLISAATRGERVAELRAPARQGDRTSVTELEAGSAADAAANTQVLAVDVEHDTRRELLRGRPHRLVPSPDGRYLAWFEENPSLPRERVSAHFAHEELYEAVNWGTELNILDVASGSRSAPTQVMSAGYDAMSWSHDGQFAIPGRIRVDSDGAADQTGAGLLVFRNGRVESADGAGLSRIVAASARWAGGRLVIRGRNAAGDRLDWWLLEAGTAHNLTADLQTAPAALIPLPDGTLLGAAGGDLWLISHAAPPINLSREVDAPIGSVAALDPARGVLSGTVGGRRSILRLEDGRLTVARIEPPLAGAVLRGTSPAGDAALFVSTGADGTRLHIAGGGGRPLSDATTLWHGNRWVADIESGAEHFFRYTGAGGREHGAWLLLPPGHQPDTPLPLVVEVYPGSVQEEGAAPFSLHDSYYLNAHLFAARGYAVLVPGMSDIEALAAADRLPALTADALAAVDTLVARGIVDTGRVAIFGYSNGGYATLGIIAHTDRFRAALAFSSLSNLASLYGTFYGQRRYGDGGDPQAGQVLRMQQLERGYGAMGLPPWEDPAAYIAASPLFHAGRVTTPVMLVHGDMDFVPVQQAEEFFTAMYRQDKRVKLVVYHGEGHSVTTRGNVMDVWQRIDAWLAETLGPLPE